MRALFTLNNPQYKVDYAEFDMHINDERQFIFATLDGILTDENGKKGILEIKTANISSRSARNEWQDRIPDHYYVQILHQMLATGFDFAIVYAMLNFIDGKSRLQSYTFYRYDECFEDMDYLLEKEVEFWQLVQSKKRPALILPEI